jgi:hypothetical protein
VDKNLFARPFFISIQTEFSVRRDPEGGNASAIGSIAIFSKSVTLLPLGAMVVVRRLEFGRIHPS